MSNEGDKPKATLSRSGRPTEPGVWRGGDATCGYEVRIDRPRALLRLTMWGFWKSEMGVTYRDATFTAMGEMAKIPSWDVLADLSRYPAQNAAVQKCHAEQHGLLQVDPGLPFRAANLVDNTLSEMQIGRLSSESGLPLFAFFQDEAHALAWLQSAP